MSSTSNEENNSDGNDEGTNNETKTDSDKKDTDKKKTDDGKDTSQSSEPFWTVIVTVIVLLLVVFFFWVLFQIIDPITLTTGSFTCAPGQCVANRDSGEKICPNDTNALQYDPTIQYCSDPELCTDNQFPFALNSDGSTNVLGECPDGVNCRCTNFIQCPEYIASAFRTISGDPYTNLQASRSQFTQFQATSFGGTSVAGANIGDNPDLISFGDPNSNFCTIPLVWLYRSNPGCNFITEDKTDFSSLEQCMNSGLEPCEQGNLALVSDNPGTATLELSSTPVACVKDTTDILGNPLPCGNQQVAVYDTQYGGVVCISS